MIEFLGVLYTVGKAAYGFYKDNQEYVEVAKDGYDALKTLKEYFEVKEGDPKLIDMAWVAKSGFQDRVKVAGYTLFWSRADKVASHELDGHELMYEIDKDKKVKRKLVLYDGLTLMGKKA
jgi:hypothetical protein